MTTHRYIDEHAVGACIYALKASGIDAVNIPLGESVAWAALLQMYL